MENALTTHTADAADARDDLVAAGRLIEELGLCPARSGNLSVRIDDTVIITPTGTQLGRLDRDQLSVVCLDGTPRSGPAASKELPLHLNFYRRSPAHRAVVHLHSSYAVAVSCRPPWSERSALPPLTPYFVMRVGPVPLVPYARPGSVQLAAQLAATPGTFRAALLQNHGSLVAHDELGQAVDAAIELEATARLSVLLGGEGNTLSDRDLAELVETFGALQW